jgi:PPP family 3-phenylpropionic acid transporter
MHHIFTKHPLLLPKLYYFSFFAALGTTLPYLQLHYRAIGLNETEIGLIGSLPSLIGLLSGSMWTAIADGLRLHKQLLPFSVIGWGGTMLALSIPNQFAPIMAIVCIQTFLASPLTPLADNGVLTLLKGKRELYGQQRLWGSIGWAISAFVCGWLISQWGMLSIFVAFAIYWLFTLFSASQLPADTTTRADMRNGLLSFVRDPRWSTLLISAFLLYVGNTANVGFRTLFFQDIGMSTTMIGITDGLSGLIEIPFMLGSAVLVRKFAPRKLLLVASLIYLCLALIQWLIPYPIPVFIGHLLRGVAFALFWPSGVVEVQSMAPRGMVATAQNLFGAAMFSFASLIANPVSGWLYHNFGATAMFQFATVCISLAVFGLWANNRLKPNVA